ncbi:MAG: uracil-DNA glycosylase [Thermoanaerobaculaceae bacterium]|nr:uracil-DNA glycosylase [Thermoanaerobaculaceae bacterium]TAM56063.1 MAG: uracil-DNA glycosylase [Acidobacteriota bacterium]
MSRRELLEYLQDLAWRDVEEPAAAGTKRAAGAAAPDAAAGEDPLASTDLAAMGRALAPCRRCRLHQGRTQVVFGVGNPRARVVFVGEGPGADEDRTGEPFVGRAGQLLTAMLPSIGLKREDVYIANVVKCRPPGNRDPEQDEAAACLPFLKRQIELIDPAVIVCLGRVAARHLLGTTAPISSYRGRWTTWAGRDVLPTFHPAYLLRNPAAKRDSWADFKKLRARLMVDEDKG